MIESDLQRTILHYLRLHRIWHGRYNTGAMHMQGRFVRFCAPGHPDILAYRYPHFVAIECKSARGKLTAEQEEFRSDFESRPGCMYIVARALEDVLEAFEPVTGGGRR